jgi:hypothetical protein
MIAALTVLSMMTLLVLVDTSGGGGAPASRPRRIPRWCPFGSR